MLGQVWLLKNVQIWKKLSFIVAGTAHPMIHGVKESMKIPQPALEEEVTESSMATFLEHQQRVQEKVEKLERDGAHLMFEISSDDGFSCKAESMEG